MTISYETLKTLFEIACEDLGLDPSNYETLSIRLVKDGSTYGVLTGGTKHAWPEDDSCCADGACDDTCEDCDCDEYADDVDGVEVYDDDEVGLCGAPFGGGSENGSSSGVTLFCGDSPPPALVFPDDDDL